MLGRKDFVEAKTHRTINLEVKKSRMMLVNQARELAKATGQEKGIILCPICKKDFRQGCKHSVNEAKAFLQERYLKSLLKEK